MKSSNGGYHLKFLRRVINRKRRGSVRGVKVLDEYSNKGDKMEVGVKRERVQSTRCLIHMCQRTC